MKLNIWAYLIVAVVLVAVFSTIGLAFFGITLVAGSLIGLGIGLFIPAILVAVALGVLYFYRNQPKFSIPVAIIILLLAWGIANLPGGGW